MTAPTEAMRLADEYAVRWARDDAKYDEKDETRAALQAAIVAYGDAQWNAGRDAAANHISSGPETWAIIDATAGRAMCAKLKRIVDGYEQSPTGICGTAEEAAALIRQQAEQIDYLVSLNKSTLETGAEQIADRFKDAERYRFIRDALDDDFDRVLAAIKLESNQIDAAIDAAMQRELDRHMTEYKPGEIANNN